MMATRCQSVELAIEHVREPGQWMPEVRLAVEERPPDIGGGEACPHMAVLRHVQAVVDFDEAEPPNRPVEHDDAQEEETGDQPG